MAEIVDVYEFARVLGAVSRVFKVDRKTILGKGRWGHVVEARYAATWIAIEDGCSHAEVSRHLGRHHSTISYAYEVFSSRLPDDDRLRRRVESIQAEIAQRAPPATMRPPDLKSEHRLDPRIGRYVAAIPDDTRAAAAALRRRRFSLAGICKALRQPEHVVAPMIGVELENAA